jgi:hypothetical protein
LSFLFSLVFVAGVTLMLHSHPQLVHLGEVQQDKVNRVSDCAIQFSLAEVEIYQSGENILLKGFVVISCEMPKIMIFTHTLCIGITLVFIHELVVRARQLDSVAQLVKALESQGYRFDSAAREPILICIFFVKIPLSMLPQGNC